MTRRNVRFQIIYWLLELTTLGVAGMEKKISSHYFFSTLTGSRYLVGRWRHCKFLRHLARPIPHQRALHRLVLVLKAHVLVNVFRRLRRIYAYAYAYNTRDPTNQEPSAYCWLKVGYSDTHVTVPEPHQKIVWILEPPSQLTSTTHIFEGIVMAVNGRY